MANRLTVRTALQTAGLKAVQRAAPVAVQQAVDATALAIESEAKQRAPVDTGRLRSSIAASLGQPGLRATVGVYVHYALFQELGSRYTPARPFLYPAAESERLRFVERLRAALAGRL